jgi:hypothetical protein
LKTFCQTELNKWNWTEQCKLGNWQHNLQKTKKPNSQATEQASLLTVVLWSSFLLSNCFNVLLWFNSFIWHERLIKLLILFLCRRQIPHGTLGRIK